ncbi:DUF4376 domain-containing protein [Phaeobacter sp. 11ANDIMAR09]|uniref:DUF4376 domain-containing protein n=1 Tax=Phaeobacter sp. 11ANDIMAR09 TaxID=1225647 RepID=UPI0006C8E261|nr:DUF4376 domain-containing protein [Phaeobacter sp. 11ANDIMAR09]KPD10858.1 hypothetical protein AN476_18550 [Phaeobacter sp. 11ANDIMAR09]
MSSNIDFTQTITANDIHETQKARLNDELAHLRWQAETGGLLTPDGTLVRTDRETRASLTEAVNALQAGLMQGPVPWKMADGWADLSQTELEAITSAVAGHVQVCFAAERTVQAQIEASEDPASFNTESAFKVALNALQTAA